MLPEQCGAQFGSGIGRRAQGQSWACSCPIGTVTVMRETGTEPHNARAHTALFPVSGAVFNPVWQAWRSAFHLCHPAFAAARERFSPSTVRGPVEQPPCIRHRLPRATAGAPQGVPFLVRAPHFGLSRFAGFQPMCFGSPSRPFVHRGVRRSRHSLMIASCSRWPRPAACTGTTGKCPVGEVVAYSRLSHSRYSSLDALALAKAAQTRRNPLVSRHRARIHEGQGCPPLPRIGPAGLRASSLSASKPVLLPFSFASFQTVRTSLRKSRLTDCGVPLAFPVGLPVFPGLNCVALLPSPLPLPGFFPALCGDGFVGAMPTPL